MGAVHRIVVGVHGSLGSLQALRWAAEEARERHVPLVPVIAWVPPGGDLAERSHPSPYLRQPLARGRPRPARPRRSTRPSAACPATCRVQSRVERGDTGPVLVDVADQPGDLLVIGTGRRHRAEPRAAPLGRPLLPGARHLPGARGAAVAR